MAKTEGPKDNEGNLWIKSKAKKQLIKDLLSGHVPLESAEMKAEDVYNLADRCEIFHQFPFKNFRPNLNRLRKDHLEMYRHSDNMGMLVDDEVIGDQYSEYSSKPSVDILSKKLDCKQVSITRREMRAPVKVKTKAKTQFARREDFKYKAENGAPPRVVHSLFRSETLAQFSNRLIDVYSAYNKS